MKKGWERGNNITEVMCAYVCMYFVEQSSFKALHLKFVQNDLHQQMLVGMLHYELATTMNEQLLHGMIYG